MYSNKIITSFRYTHHQAYNSTSNIVATDKQTNNGLRYIAHVYNYSSEHKIILHVSAYIDVFYWLATIGVT